MQPMLRRLTSLNRIFRASSPLASVGTMNVRREWLTTSLRLSEFFNFCKKSPFIKFMPS